VIYDDSEGGDCDEVICSGWGEPGGEFVINSQDEDEECTGWGWRNEEGSWFHRKGDTYL